MSKTPCCMVYEDKYYQGLDDLLLRIARDEAA